MSVLEGINALDRTRHCMAAAEERFNVMLRGIAPLAGMSTEEHAGSILPLAPQGAMIFEPKSFAVEICLSAAYLGTKSP